MESRAEERAAKVASLKRRTTTPIWEALRAGPACSRVLPVTHNRRNSSFILGVLTKDYQTLFPFPTNLQGRPTPLALAILQCVGTSYASLATSRPRVLSSVLATSRRRPTISALPFEQRSDPRVLASPEPGFLASPNPGFLADFRRRPGARLRWWWRGSKTGDRVRRVGEATARVLRTLLRVCHVGRHNRL